MKLKKGMKVTVSVKALLESEHEPIDGYIDTEENETGDTGYWDLYTNKNGLVCMDGETCIVVDVDEVNKIVVLRNEDGEYDVKFELSFDAAKVCCKCIDIRR